jgi:hypothetical protein
MFPTDLLNIAITQKTQIKMNVQLIKDENGLAIGWSMQGENPEEISKLAIIRDLQFFGFDESAIRYNGRKTDHLTKEEKETNPGILSWKQRKHCS